MHVHQNFTCMNNGSDADQNFCLIQCYSDAQLESIPCKTRANALKQAQKSEEVLADQGRDTKKKLVKHLMKCNVSNIAHILLYSLCCLLERGPNLYLNRHPKGCCELELADISDGEIYSGAELTS